MVEGSTYGSVVVIGRHRGANSLFRYKLTSMAGEAKRHADELLIELLIAIQNHPQNYHKYCHLDSLNSLFVLLAIDSLNRHR